MKRKLISALLCVAMMATFAVGCEGKSSDDAEKTQIQKLKKQWKLRMKEIRLLLLP